MLHPLATAAAVATLALAPFAAPEAASAQTWGQPLYLNAYGRPVGGSPLSEVETRSYVETGHRADGYSDRPRVYVPAPGYGHPRVSDGNDYGHSARGYGRNGHDRPSRPGYRDEWGYNDDRPWADQRRRSDRSRAYGSRDCGCADVYVYDR